MWQEREMTALRSIRTHWVQFALIQRWIVLSESQHVRVSVLRLRGSVPRQYNRSTLSDEPILRWRIPQLWSASTAVLGYTARGTNWPHGLCVSPRYQVYIPQIRSFGYNTTARFSLHFAIKYRQWKDIHLHLVLVLHTRLHVSCSDNISSSDHLRSNHTAENTTSIIENIAHRNLPER